MSNQELASLIIGKLMNIGGMLQKKGNQLLLPFNLNQQQFSILFEISKEEKVKQKNMVNRLCLERAHVSKVVKKLKSMGLIEVSESSDDKRSAWLVMTSEGKKTISECKKHIQEWNQEWMLELNAEELHTHLDSLTALQEVFKKRDK